jgi:hypothetical protein
MYQKTHGNIGAGVQNKREYNWNINPDQHVFGYGERVAPNQAARAVHSERFEASFPKTVIVQKTVEDIKSVAHDQLGKAKNLGQGAHPIPTDTIFGVRSLKDATEWNAAKCLSGNPTVRELRPDTDLGKSTRPGTRNIVRRTEDENRVFGCPSVRTDIPMPKLKSVADHQNYGDEPEAIDILFPATYTELGVSEVEFTKFRPKHEIENLFAKIGHSYKPGKFNAIFNRSVEYAREMNPGRSIPQG